LHPTLDLAGSLENSICLVFVAPGPLAQLLRSGKGGIGIFGGTLDIAFSVRLPEGCKLGMFSNRVNLELYFDPLLSNE